MARKTRKTRNSRKKSKAGKRLKYNMHGCSKKNHKNHKHPKIYLGGQNMPVPSTGPPPNPYIGLNSKSQSGGQCGTNLFGGNNAQKGGSSTFVGNSWSPTNWPSANNANHYPMNTYTPVDIQLQTKVLGANPPFSKGGRRNKRRTLQKGGNLSNSIIQDLTNFGRGLSYSSGSAYNTVMGVSAPVDPLPWKGQLTSTIGSRI